MVVMDLTGQWTLEDELLRWQEELQDSVDFEDGESKIEFCKEIIEDIKEDIKKRDKNEG